MRLRARRAAVSENKYIFYEHQDREAVQERAFPAHALGLFPEFTARPGDSDTGKTAVGTGHVARALLAAPKPHAELRRMDHQAKYEQGCAGPSSPRKALRVVWSGAPPPSRKPVSQNRACPAERPLSICPRTGQAELHGRRGPPRPRPFPRPSPGSTVTRDHCAQGAEGGSLGVKGRGPLPAASQGWLAPGRPGRDAEEGPGWWGQHSAR